MLLLSRPLTGFADSHRRSNTTLRVGPRTFTVLACWSSWRRSDSNRHLLAYEASVFPITPPRRADDRTRTGDFDLGKVALYQLSYVRESGWGAVDQRCN